MAPEKSSFAQTCNLLSQFLKGRGGSFGDISFGLHGNLETNYKGLDITRSTKTMNLLPNMETSNEISSKQNPNSTFDQEPEKRSAQMTIFYAGQVIVFDDFLADKAMEVIALATKGTSIDNSNDSANIIINSQQPQTVCDSDLPIARKASLKKFFEKRKERVATRAPYQLNKPKVAEKGNLWFNVEEEAQSSRQLELKL